MPARTDGRVGFHVLVTAGVTGKTGIEMEALTGASAACLTIYDMCKAVDRGMEIVDVRLLHKEGGRSGVWDRAGRQAAAVEAVAADGAAPASAPVAVAPAAPTPAVPAIAFIGYQNSGKTTLVEKVIAELTRRGLRVGSLKHHGHHALISMYPLRTPGAITKPDPSMWASSAPRVGRSTPTRARRTRCPRASCCRATTMSTW